MPGHGKSLEGIADKKIEKFDDVADIVVDTLKENHITKATFFCVSLGTLVFTSILLKYPEIVNGAVLCGAISGINRVLQITLNFLDKIKFCFPYMFLLTLFSYILLPFSGHKISRDFFIKSGKLMGRNEFMAWFHLLVKNIDILKNVKNVKNKILFIMGNEDFTFFNGVKRKYNELKETKIKILKHCGHVCNIQKWKEFNDISLRFLEELY